MYCCNTTCTPVQVTAIMVLWKVVHVDTPMYGNVLLAFENPKSDQVTSGAKRVINMDEEDELKK